LPGRHLTSLRPCWYGRFSQIFWKGPSAWSECGPWWRWPLPTSNRLDEFCAFSGCNYPNYVARKIDCTIWTATFAKTWVKRKVAAVCTFV